AGGVRGFWKFRRSAADRRAGHDLSESERSQFLGVLRRRSGHGGELFRSRRRGEKRLDLIHAAGRYRGQGSALSSDLERADDVDPWIYFPDHVVVARR